MKTSCRAVLLLAVLLPLFACAYGPVLRVEPAPGIEELHYDAILFGGRYSEDLESMAILVIRGAPYRILPYAPKFDYRVIKDLSAPQALEAATRFLSAINPNFTGTTINRILDPEGNPIGYEVRPLYQPFVYGLSDILETSYRVWSKGIVRAWIEVTPSVERQGGWGGNRLHERGR